MLKRSFAIHLLLLLALAFASPAQAQDEHPSGHKHRHHHHHGHSHKHGHHHKHKHGGHFAQKHYDGRQPVSKSRNRTCKTAPCFKKHPSGHYTTSLKHPQHTQEPSQQLPKP